jgi:hypothetical protein
MTKVYSSLVMELVEQRSSHRGFMLSFPELDGETSRNHLLVPLYSLQFVQRRDAL